MQDLDDIKRRLTTNAGTKFVTYATQINPKLPPHPMYIESARTLYEYHCTTTTRLRTTSHNLAVETDGCVQHVSSDYANADMSKQTNMSF